jgi:hypothetical protein
MGNDYGMRVIDRGRASLGRLGREIDEADPGGSVLPRSRVLCAGLAELATGVLSVLGPRDREHDVTDLAASLSLLTKIDDEVIDSLEFHGGAASARDFVRKKTEIFLDETRRSIETGEAHSPEPRCLLAARVGRRMRDLAASAASHDALLQLVRDGWRTQADAVALLTGDARAADPGEIDRVTRRISGDWLALIAACGTLPSGSSLSHDEVEAIRDAGAFIQRADALADLEKDQREGLTSTWAACAIARMAPATSLPAMYRSAALLDLEREAWPSVAALACVRHRLARFPEIVPALEWIRVMLLSRYRAHALHASPSATQGGAACGGH